MLTEYCAPPELEMFPNSVSINIRSLRDRQTVAALNTQLPQHLKPSTVDNHHFSRRLFSLHVRSFLNQVEMCQNREQATGS